MSFTYPASALAYLNDLAANNDKTWFQANKKRYEKEFKAPNRALVDAVNEELGAIAPQWVTPAGKALNRINRDIRFSKDKTPYNTHVWAGFHREGAAKGSSAGYYFGFDPTGSVGIGCGAWMPPKPYIDNLRAHVAEHHGELRQILDAAGIDELNGEKYKRVPKPYPADHPAAEWLKHKGFHHGWHTDFARVTDPDLVDIIASRLVALKPLVDFLDRGLGG